MGSAAIPLSFESPKFQPIDPLGASAKAMSLYSAAQGISLNQQRIAEETLRAKQMERDQADDDYANQIIGEAGGDVEKAMPLLMGKVQAKNVLKWKQGYRADIQAAATLARDKVQTFQAHGEAIAQEAAKHLQLSPEERAAEVPASRARLEAAGVPLSHAPFLNSDTPSDRQLQAAITGSKYWGNILSNAQKQEATRLATQQAERLKQKTEQEDKVNAYGNAAREYLLVQDQAGHGKFLGTQTAKDAGLTQENFGTFKPENSRKLNDLAVTAEQRALGRHRDEVADAKAQVDAARAERDAAKTANDYEIKTGNLRVAELRAQTAIDNMNRMRETIERKETSKSVAARLVKETTGHKIDDTINNLSNPDYYQGDEEVQKLRGDIFEVLQRWKKEGATYENILSRTKLNESRSTGGGGSFGRALLDQRNPLRPAPGAAPGPVPKPKTETPTLPNPYR